MANAAAKKAAAARQGASNIYKPTLLVINLVYIYFRIIRNWDTWTIRPMFMTGLFWIMTYFCYHGILLDHENMVSVTSSKVVAADGSSSKQSRLPGGIYLDILALVLLMQFGSLWKQQLLWLLIIFPFWGGYTLYQTVFKGMIQGMTQSSSSSSTSSASTTEDAAVDEKRRKRAERRRQKWA
jgi:hypothetical protein